MLYCHGFVFTCPSWQKLGRSSIGGVPDAVSHPVQNRSAAMLIIQSPWPAESVSGKGLRPSRTLSNIGAWDDGLIAACHLLCPPAVYCKSSISIELFRADKVPEISVQSPLHEHPRMDVMNWPLQNCTASAAVAAAAASTSLLLMS